jgi:SHS family lactate transporter-like MFS transporter
MYFVLAWRSHMEQLAASVNLSLVQDKDDWRPLFWLGAGLSLFAAILRLIIPESQAFLAAKAAGQTGHKNKTFLKETVAAVKAYKWRCVYGILLMTGL